MKHQFIFEKELEKINIIFALMNQISDSSQKNFIQDNQREIRSILFSKAFISLN